MARASYKAPGVYVEEVPSTRQPIAGVGTNTVGFIGLVPDVVYIPQVAAKYVPEYDPEKAKKAMEARAKAADEAEAAALKKRIEARSVALSAELATAEKGLVPAAKERDDATKKRDDATKKRDDATKKRDDATKKRDDAKKAREGLQQGADPAAADKALADADAVLAEADAALAGADAAVTEAKEAFEKATGVHDKLDQQVNELKSRIDAVKAKAEAEDDYASEPPSLELINDKEATDWPYYLKKFVVRPEEFATKLCTNFSEYTSLFGDFSGFTVGKVTSDPKAMWPFRPLSPGHHMLTHAVHGFFKNGGTRCFVARVKSVAGLKKALQRFESIDEVAIIAAPGLPKDKAVWEELQGYCEHEDHQNVFAILDTPGIVGTAAELNANLLTYDDKDNSLLPRESKYAALYFPFIEVSDPAKRLQDEDPVRGVEPKYRGLTYVPPSGHMAGVYARIDEERGVHKAPANAVVRGALEVKYYVSKAMQAGLNPQGVNCLRIMGGAVVAWGARTLGGDRNGEWKYVNVRRFAGFLMESIDEGTQWVVFEPNDPALWSKIRLNVTAFLTNVWRNGALFGLTPEEAFYVKCDEELNPPEVRDLGQVITEIGVAIVRPAEFVIFRISQFTGGQKT